MQQVEQCAAESLEGPCWAPISLYDVQADLSGDEVDVGVEDLGLEVQFGRSDRVVRGEADLDKEDMSGIWSVAGSFDEGLPSQQIVFVEHK